MKKGAMRGLGRVYRRPDSQLCWIRYIGLDGREYRESTKSTSHADAVDLLRKRNAEKLEGTLVAPADRRVTVAELLDDMVADYRMRKLASTRTVTAHRATLIDLDPTTQRAGTQGIGHLPAAKLTTARLTRLITTWQAAGDATATINKRLGTLRAAYYLARDANPLKVQRVPRIPRLPEDNARQGFFEKADLQALLTHLPDDGLRDFVEWGAWTGMRKGEIASLTWAAVDRETWTLTLPAKDSKNRRPRRIPLLGPLRTVIERRLAARRLDTALIFFRLRLGKPCRVYEFRKAWNRASRAAGINGRLFHDLRRTAARNLVRAGVDRKTAMRITGHVTESMFARYSIDTDDDIRDAIARVTDYVERLPDTRRVVPLTA